jgi:hypothetical protein
MGRPRSRPGEWRYTKEGTMSWKCLIAALVSIGFAALAHASPFAMVTEVKGDPTATLAGKSRTLTLLAFIQGPEEVSVAPKGRLVVTYFASGMQYSVEGPARLVLAATAPQVLQGAAERRKISPDKWIGEGGLSHDQWRRLTVATHVMRDATSSFSVLSPNNSVVLAPAPLFEWTPAAGVKRYKLVLYGPQNQVLHEEITAATALRPAHNLNLQPGIKYRWKVDQLGVAQPRSASGVFSMATEAERMRALAGRSEEPNLASRLYYATMLEAEGYENDAREEWRALIKDFPEVQEARRRPL